MTIEELKKAVTEDSLTYKEVGFDLFSTDRTDAEMKGFIETLLDNRFYEKLCGIMNCVFINRQYYPGYMSMSPSNIGAQYFGAFLNLCTQCKVAFDKLFPLFIATFYAEDESNLFTWKSAAGDLLLTMLRENFPEVSQKIISIDPELKCFGLLITADKAASEQILFNLLFSDNTSKELKTKLRLYTLEYNVNMTPLFEIYKDCALEKRKDILRLLLLHKNDNRVTDFFEYVLTFEENIVLRSMLIKKRYKVKMKLRTRNKYYADENSPCFTFVEVDGKRYRIDITRDLQLVYKKKGARKVEEFKNLIRSVKKDVASKKQAFIDAMICKVGIKANKFYKLLRDDKLFALISESILFYIEDEYNYRFAITFKGKLRNLENEELEIDKDEMIYIVHPIMLTGENSYLKDLEIDQCFNQLNRALYFTDNNDRISNVCMRFNGLLVNAHDFKTRVRRNDFKFFHFDKDGYAVQAGKLRAGIWCVVEFSPFSHKDLNRNITLGNVRFYNDSDLIKTAGSIYTLNVPVKPINNISKREFSEFISDVYSLVRE